MRSAAALLTVLLIAASGPSPTRPSQAPDACKLLTVEDVTGVLGAGYSAAKTEGSGCEFRKDRINFVSIMVASAPDGDGKGVLRKRREAYEKKNKGVIEAPGVCNDAFVVAVNATTAILMTAKGGWTTELQVMVDGKGDMAAEQNLGRVACSRLP